jgi:C4-dicarboxylate-binding protein DctP
MSDDDSLDALAFGEVQMIAISLSKLDRLTHRFQIFDLPFLFPDLPTVEKFQASDNGQELLTSMVDRKLLGLSFWHNGMKQFGGPVPMRTPEAAKGLKFRIMESDVLQAQILQIGGNPQKMAFGEVYQALQTGAVDAQENTWSNIYSSKFYEVQAHVTETNHGYLGYLVAVNPDFWNSLPDDIRAELAAIVQEVSAWANDQSASINIAGREKIIASGQTEVTELTPEERAGWQRAMRPVWEKFSDNIGADLIEAAEAYGKQTE